MNNIVLNYPLSVENYYNQYDKEKKPQQPVTGLMIAGACLALSEILKDIEGAASLTGSEIWYDYTSGLRDGNRVDVVDDIFVNEEETLVVSFIYFVDEGAKAVIYDCEEDKYIIQILLEI